MQQVDWNTQRVVGGDNIEHASTKGREGKMIVTGRTALPLHTAKLITSTVSATDEVRDDLRKAVRDHLSEKVQFYELDYQP